MIGLVLSWWLEKRGLKTERKPQLASARYSWFDSEALVKNDGADIAKFCGLHIDGNLNGIGAGGTFPVSLSKMLY